MTKTTDKQLNNWLNAYEVDTSTLRLDRLEDQIFLNIAIRANSIFSPMGLNEKILTGVAVCSITLAVLLISKFTQDPSVYSFMIANSYIYEGY